jgi:hypothetical protein
MAVEGPNIKPRHKVRKARRINAKGFIREAVLRCSS